jgi:hypothetical protein
MNERYIKPSYIPDIECQNYDNNHINKEWNDNE